MRVLITGAAGFIGSQLARHLIHRADVIGIDDLSTGRLENVADLDMDLVQASILDERALRRAMEGCDGVVHLAARPSVPRSIADPAASHHANATGTLSVLEAARASNSPQVIVASSSSVYGANPILPKREDLVPMPLSPYAVSKLATEQYALAWQHSFGLRTLAFRFFNVYGPHQHAGHAYAAVIPAFVSAALHGHPLIIHGDGRQSRDFTYVGTVCGVIVDALERRITHHQPVNLAFGSRHTLLDVASMLEGAVGHSLEREHVDPRAGDVRHSQADNSVLRGLFPEVLAVSLQDGLDTTIDWMRSQ